jgi:hypothetical protein
LFPTKNNATAKVSTIKSGVDRVYTKPQLFASTVLSKSFQGPQTSIVSLFSPSRAVVSSPPKNQQNHDTEKESSVVISPASPPYPLLAESGRGKSPGLPQASLERLARVLEVDAEGFNESIAREIKEEKEKRKKTRKIRIVGSTAKRSVGGSSSNGRDETDEIRKGVRSLDDEHVYQAEEKVALVEAADENEQNSFFSSWPEAFTRCNEFEKVDKRDLVAVETLEKLLSGQSSLSTGLKEPEEFEESVESEDMKKATIVQTEMRKRSLDDILVELDYSSQRQEIGYNPWIRGYENEETHEIADSVSWWVPLN